jgi:hypothetical protein
MRAWPTRLSGLKLTLPSGWYTLPWYMPADEVHRFLDLLRMGLEIDYAVELEWAGLDELAGRASLDKSVVVLRIPGEVDPQTIVSAQAKLGGVRIGLVLHERAGDWAYVDWQQHLIKAPLLSALNRELHLGEHPFAGLGIDALPLDELAKLTPEPVELLELLDSVIDHRLTHATQGLAREDWKRSIDVAVADRLATRLSIIPLADQAAALDLAIDTREQPLWPAIDRRDASRALAHVGLAWREGNEVLIGALARQAGEPAILRRLLTQLPERAWSKWSRSLLLDVLPRHLPLPRAAPIAPEPRYADWPVVERDEVIEEVRRHISNHFFDIDEDEDDHDHDEFFEFMFRFREFVNKRALQLKLWDLPDTPWGMALDAIVATFAELHDDALLEFDYERGQLYRFNAVDQALVGLPGQAEVGALVRWMGITELVRHTFDHRRLGILAGEIERSIDLVNENTVLRDALRVTLGDLWALRQHHEKALDCWTNLAGWLDRQRGVILRRKLAILRIDPARTSLDEMRTGTVMVEYHRTGDTRYEDEISQVVALLSGKSILSHTGASPTLTICRAAVALERQDWPLAIHLLDTLDESTTPPEAARARLIWAWTRVALGDIDLAGTTFEEIAQLAARWGDELLAQFAADGIAWVASRTST